MAGTSPAMTVGGCEICPRRGWWRRYENRARNRRRVDRVAAERRGAGRGSLERVAARGGRDVLCAFSRVGGRSGGWQAVRVAAGGEEPDRDVRASDGSAARCRRDRHAALAR